MSPGDGKNRWPGTTVTAHRPADARLEAEADRIPARTAAVKTVLDAAARGGSAIADSALVTAGVKSEFGSRKIEELNGIESLTFLHEQDVSGCRSSGMAARSSGCWRTRR